MLFNNLSSLLSFKWFIGKLILLRLLFLKFPIMIPIDSPINHFSGIPLKFPHNFTIYHFPKHFKLTTQTLILQLVTRSSNLLLHSPILLIVLIIIPTMHYIFIQFKLNPILLPPPPFLLLPILNLRPSIPLRSLTFPRFLSNLIQLHISPMQNQFKFKILFPSTLSLGFRHIYI